MDDETRRIDGKMLTCLRVSDFDGLFQIAVNELKPRIIGDLVKNLRLSPEDAEDCVFDVMKKVFVRASNGTLPSLISPVDYLWRASKNQGLTLLNRRKSDARAKSEVDYLAGNGLTGFRHRGRSLSQQDSARDASRPDVGMPTRAALADLRTAVILVESLLDDSDTEPDPTRLVEVVGVAISRLTPVLAEVVDYLLRNGFDVKAADAARELGIRNVPTFRKRKERAYAQLRNHIADVMRELDVELRIRIEEAVEPPEEFPSVDEADDS